MEETLASPKMAGIDLINNLERISSEIPNRILKLEGYILKENHKEHLEILIFKGFSSSTTHQIEIDSEKQVIEFDHYFTNFILCEAPLTKGSEVVIRENTNSLFLLTKVIGVKLTLYMLIIFAHLLHNLVSSIPLTVIF